MFQLVQQPNAPFHLLHFKQTPREHSFIFAPVYWQSITMHFQNWILAAASVTGAAHYQHQLPCQDYSGFVQLSPDSGIAVVCDGAGSCQNAAQGAQQTAALALHYFAEYCRTQTLCETNILPTDEQWRIDAIENLLRIKDDLAQYAQTHDIHFSSLSCTIIVLIYLPQGLLCAHIGDGRAAYRNDKGEWSAMITPFHGEEINTTVFITSDIWQDTDLYLETCVVAEPVSAFCLLSDGCEKASFEVNLLDVETGKYYDPNRPYPPFFEPNVTALRQLQPQGISQAEINQHWASFLEAGNDTLRRETDDKTMILGVKTIDSCLDDLA